MKLKFLIALFAAHFTPCEASENLVRTSGSGVEESLPIASGEITALELDLKRELLAERISDSSDENSNNSSGREHEESSSAKSPKSPRGRGVARVVRRSQTITRDTGSSGKTLAAKDDEETRDRQSAFATASRARKLPTLIASKASSLPSSPISPRRLRQVIAADTFEDPQVQKSKTTVITSPQLSPRGSQKLGGHRKKQEYTVEELDVMPTEIITVDSELSEFIGTSRKELQAVMEEELNEYGAAENLFVTQPPTTPSPELQAPEEEAPLPPTSSKIERAAEPLLRNSAGRTKLTDSTKLRIVLRGRSSGAETRKDEQKLTSPDQEPTHEQALIGVEPSSPRSPRSPRSQSKASKLLGIDENELQDSTSLRIEKPGNTESEKSPRLRAKNSARAKESLLSESSQTAVVSEPYLLTKPELRTKDELSLDVFEKLKTDEIHQLLKNNFAGWVADKPNERTLNQWPAFFGKFCQHVIEKIRSGKLEFSLLDLETFISQLFKKWLENESDWE